MIVGERILEVKGNKAPNLNIKGLNINIQIDDVKVVDENLEITYVYTADYQDSVGQIMIKGVLLSKEESKLTKEVADMWKKNKKVPDEFAAVILSALNYSGSANGTLVARVLGLTAPLIPPKIQITKPDAGPAPSRK